MSELIANEKMLDKTCIKDHIADNTSEENANMHVSATSNEIHDCKQQAIISLSHCHRPADSSSSKSKLIVKLAFGSIVSTTCTARPNTPVDIAKRKLCFSNGKPDVGEHRCEEVVPVCHTELPIIKGEADIDQAKRKLHFPGNSPMLDAAVGGKRMCLKAGRSCDNEQSRHCGEKERLVCDTCTNIVIESNSNEHIAQGSKEFCANFDDSQNDERNFSEGEEEWISQVVDPTDDSDAIVVQNECKIQSTSQAGRDTYIAPIHHTRYRNKKPLPLLQGQASIRSFFSSKTINEKSTKRSTTATYVPAKAAQVCNTERIGMY